MLAIKLSRVGKKKRPSYRVVVTEKSRDPWGRNTEIIGFYNPLSTPKEIRFKEDRVKHWLSVGAQPTDTVHNLLVNAGLIDAKKKKGHPTHKLSAEELAEKEAEKQKKIEAAKAKEEAAKAAAEAEKAAAEAEKVAAEAPAEETPSEETPAPEAKAEEAAPAEEKKEEVKAEEAPAKEEKSSEEEAK